MPTLYPHNKTNKEVKTDTLNYRGDYLVMIGEWNDGGTHTQDHGRVDLTVGIGGAVLDVLV